MRKTNDENSCNDKYKSVTKNIESVFIELVAGKTFHVKMGNILITLKIHQASQQKYGKKCIKIAFQGGKYGAGNYHVKEIEENQWILNST
jgi:hypothetical protein